MSDDATPRLNLPYLAAAQAQKHVTLNEALAALDGLVQTAVESRTTTAEPAAPADGALYILPAARTGPEWSLHPVGSLLRFEIGTWERLVGAIGSLAYVKDEGRFVVRRADGWADLGAALQALDLQRLGVGAVADAANPLSVRANKALFAAKPAGEGGDGDLRLTFTKEAPADVLSLLFQSGFSGRAELGLIGDDALTLKTSADGTAWKTALRADTAGRVFTPARPVFGTYQSTQRTSPGLFAGYAPLNHSLNQGGVFNPSTGLFTAPATGAYQFSLVGRSLAGVTARGAFALAVGGAVLDEFVETYGPYQDVGASAVLSLAAGQTVGVQLNHLDAGQALQAFFSGFMIG